ncbi:hypothetical protein MPSEU_000774500 [Mayamaea pseudoterrestris]|nr:hypothetical protein MPSEU_000774500 [Mayamaea pseudoterrestris]
MRMTRIRLALLSSMATACCCLTVNDAMESTLSRTSNDPRVSIEKRNNLIIAPSPSTGRRLEEPSPTIQPTTTWRPTTTWYPTTTPYPTVRPTLKQQLELDYTPYENTGYHEPRLVQPAPIDAAPSASKQTSTATTTKTSSSSSSNSHTPSRHGDGDTPARAVDDDDTASVTAASTRTVEQPAASGSSGGFGLGVGLLLAVFVAAGLLSHHNTRQRNQQLPTSGLELFDVPQRSSRKGFGGGYSDVPEADIRGPQRDYNI